MLQLIGNVIIWLTVFSSSLFAETKYWVQYMPGNQIWLRAVTEKEECPTVIMDSIRRNMRHHSQKGENMNITSCMIHIPKGVNQVKIADDNITIPTEYKKILVIGDTGCRIKGVYTQDCKNEWPFAQVANLGSQHKPDLIIHLGDYFYRDSCLAASCMDETVGDNWPAWNDDFFKPASNLLNVAPWVMVRGNHENCGRGGNGWSAFFDYRKKCYKYTNPYIVDLAEDLRLIIADSGEDNLSLEAINKINEIAADKKSWLLTHRPLWVATSKGMKYTLKPRELSDNIQTIFSGHQHVLQLSERDGKLQVISGNSGSSLYSIDKFSKEDTKEVFGFIILEKQDDKSWKMNAFDLENKIIDSHIIK